MQISNIFKLTHHHLRTFFGSIRKKIRLYRIQEIVTPNERNKYSVEVIWRLYFEELLSKSDIARKLGIANSTVHRVFVKNNWQSLPWPKKGDPEQASKLFKRGITHKEIAEKMGVSRRTVGNYLTELGVKRRFKSDLERKQYRRIKSKERLERIKQLRDDLFGTECRICGASREKRTIAIHSKDFKEHNSHALWSEPFLRKTNPEEWVALCVMCHRGVHWVHDDFEMNWKSVENHLEKGGVNQIQVSSLQMASRNNVKEDQSVEEIRKALFGSECFFCGPIPKEKIRVIHRKDGKPHRKNALNSKEFLLKTNTDDWQLLCQKHHRYVHWGMKHLGLSWEYITRYHTSKRGKR